MILSNMTECDNLELIDSFSINNPEMNNQIFNHVQLYIYDLLSNDVFLSNTQGFYVRANKLGLIVPPLPSSKTFIIVEFNMK